MHTIINRRLSKLIQGTAIIMVFIYHGFGFLGLPNYTAGQIGVDLFLLVSGYGVSASIEKYISGFQFLRARVAKLYLKYVLAIVLTIGAFGAVESPDLILHLTFLHGYSTKYFFGIDNAFWYMSLIFSMYFFCSCYSLVGS